MISKLRNLLINRKLDSSKMNDDLTAVTKGYNKIISLTDEELFGTLRLGSANTTESELRSSMYRSQQSDRFIAALLDPRTSYEYKINEVFQIVEPQNVDYIKFSFKLKLKTHPTKALNKEDIKDIKTYLDLCVNPHHLHIFMRPDLSISDVLVHLNELGSLKSDKDVDDDICKLNSERLPKVLIIVSDPQFFGCFQKLLDFYIHSLDSSSYSSRHRLMGKIIQKQSSKYISIEGTIPHRNCVYFFCPVESAHEDLCIIEDFIEGYSYLFKTLKFDNPKSDNQRSYSIYDMDFANDQINIKTNDNLYEEEVLPSYSSI
ncbi:hypothetical protein BN7_1886 [Wickerhamomyces ciferrii]|uniref:Uncharacterized protein n=1 Tax=Wickerhamomyces ciferrii (strain ATCC 14091 / BCRC 22168 / CBS 111 / JCM 3599 / NBRC 0793 / NRRL Y-1031 F-60-10) TaxID=1206466 RepID=K0KJN1_WICCF|nr:uncharacterized protein BN7_1886 [Wickerhamomyces ciferrii]CCH42342.1 hypothetical protein BN7_1886 [Wickerhamomyces ciferrii]